MLDIHTHIFITLVYVIKSPKIKLSQYDRANFYCPAVSYCKNYKVIILSLHHKKGQREDRTIYIQRAGWEWQTESEIRLG